MATKTLNPLHFEDLEPHRFEDLVRQLLYDFRNWKSLEGTGRLGSDEGIDIRGIEVFSLPPEEHEDESKEKDDSIKDEPITERLWVIQCKREKSIGPKKIKSIISDVLSSFDKPPFGVMIVAACDFSKKTRDEFRKQMLASNIQEFFIWGKAEIEDLLFMPKNDHLLFAYFGISIQIRRRSMKTTVRSRLTLKRKLVREFGELHSPAYKPILIRDPKNIEYPYINDPRKFIKNPSWRYWLLENHDPPDHLAFIIMKYFAYVDWQSEEWDVLSDCDIAVPGETIFGLEQGAFDPKNKSEIYRVYEERHVPEENRAWAMTIRFIHYDRILAVDEFGDVYNKGYHLLVDYIDVNDPFEPNRYYKEIRSSRRYDGRFIMPQDKLRKKFFPKKIPDERKTHYKELQKKYKNK